MPKSFTKHIALQSNASIFIAYTIINIIIIGMLLGIVSGNSDNLSKIQIQILYPMIIGGFALALIASLKIGSMPAKVAFILGILLICSCGIAYTQLTKPDVDKKTEVMTYFIYVFVCINWGIVGLLHCKFCEYSKK